MKYNILPYPKTVECRDGFFQISAGLIIAVDVSERRLMKKAAAIKMLLEKVDGTKHKLIGRSVENGDITVSLDSGLSVQEYTLDISETNVVIKGGSAQGCFYGLVTLEQLINQYGSQIPALFIRDYPDMEYRGFYHDATRGRVPSVAGMKNLIDELVKLKINSLQLYIEHTFDFYEFEELNRSSDDYLTAEDILAIDDYCYDNFIDFIPSLSTFGHLYELLMLKKYRELCELKDYEPKKHFWWERMAHHTIDPSNPESIKVIYSLIDQYLPLFRSEYFNICCDETMDLCMGRNKGKDSGKLYYEFVAKIISHIKENGKKVMMWGDIALEQPYALSNIPKDTIFLNWDYNTEPNLAKIDTIKESGFEQIVCPGTISWACLLGYPVLSMLNITKMTDYAFKRGVKGILNTNWGDYGDPASFENSIYGISLGACKPWNVSMKADVAFETDVSRVMYGCNKNIIPYITALSEIQDSATWFTFFEWNETHDKSVFRYDDIPVRQNALAENVVRCDEIVKKLSECNGRELFIKHLTVAAKGIKLLNIAESIIIADGDFSDWRLQADKWFDEYSELWLKENKPSELNEIKKFLNRISGS